MQDHRVKLGLILKIMKNKCDRLNMGLKENGGYMIQAFPLCWRIPISCYCYGIGESSI